jgi:hypothetical protein
MSAARLGLAAALAWGSLATAAEPALTDVPFWKGSAGWWRSDNTYFNGMLDYNIRAYNSIVHVVVDGRRITETEYKFYAPSKLALQNGRGKTTAEEGVEVVTVTTYERTDAKGDVRLTAAAPGAGRAEPTRIDVLTADTAVRVTAAPGDPVDTYRMVITQPTPDKRYKANFGIVSAAGGDAPLGDLRGFSLFRETRIAEKDFAAVRAEFRAKNRVRAVVTAGPDNAPRVDRLD